MTTFKPPIPERTTKKLLQIVSASEKWNSNAVEQARAELERRKVTKEEIKHAEYLSNKADRFEDLKKAKESYTVSDFIFEPVPTLFEIMVNWELEKDGYLKKAEQQSRFRVYIGFIVVIAVLYFNW